MITVDDDWPMAVPMTQRIESEHNEKLHQLHHDIQNCLNVISMGADVLMHARHDDATFAEFYESIREQRGEATKLLDEFFNAACKACE